MIKFTTGDILGADADALVNTVNCVGIMGRGVALQFKNAFPPNFKAYEAACARREVQPGRMFVFETGTMTNPRFIINFPTKRHWRGKSRMEDIETGLRALAEEIRVRQIRSIAVPPLGSGLGGLNWPDVRTRIEAALGALQNVDVIVFEPSGGPEASAMAHSTEVPKMTPGRAALVILMHRYLAGLLDPFVTLLEVHKLMYFMQEAGQPLRLQFAKGPYGPYAENLRHVLHAVEGHLVSGYADGGEHGSIIVLIADVDAATRRGKESTAQHMENTMNDENPAPADEIDRPQDPAPAPPPQPNRSPLVATGGRPLSIIPHSFDEAFRIGKAAVVGKWVPYGWTGEMATLAIMHGAEVGLPPMMSLQKIAVINGRPSLWGDAVPAIALATHQLEDWSETVTGEGDTMVATCMVKRKGIKTAHVVTFSVDDAKRAGLWQTEALVTKDVWEGFGPNRRKVKKDNQPNDSPWYRHPKRMLQMRARRAFRDLFADAFSGLYLAEELIGETEMKDVTPLPVEDMVDNPLGGDDADELDDVGYPMDKEVSYAHKAPGNPADAPKPKRATKPRAAPKEAPAATADAGQAIQGGYTAPEGDGDRPEPPTTGSGVIPVSTKTVPTHPDAMKVPPQATLIRWGGAEYVEYISTWCKQAVAYAAGTEGFLLETYIRDRHKKEMGARNDLGTKLTDEERERMNVICRAASKGQEW